VTRDSGSRRQAETGTGSGRSPAERPEGHRPTPVAIAPLPDKEVVELGAIALAKATWPDLSWQEIVAKCGDAADGFRSKASAVLASISSTDGGLREALDERRLQTLVDETMQATWDEICDDTNCHPLDIKQLGRRRLSFSPGHWASAIAGRLYAALAASPPDGLTEDGRCSFCTAEAVGTVSDESDIMPACADCAAAWQKDPGFLKTRPTAAEHRSGAFDPSCKDCVDYAEGAGSPPDHVLVSIEVLEPFAREASLYAESVPDALIPTIHCLETDTESAAAYSVGDLRRIGKALAAVTKPSGGLE